MAASDARHAYGFEIEISEDGATYTDILEVVNASAMERLRVEAKATHNGSPDGHTEAKPGIKRTGPLKFTLNYVAAQYEDLDAFFEDGTDLFFKVKLPLDEGESTPEQFVVRGFITKLGEIRLDPEDTSVMIYDVEIARSQSKVTRTAGA